MISDKRRILGLSLVDYISMSEEFAGKKVLVTGGAGFIGSHLVDKLLSYDAKLIVVDNLITGRRENLVEAEKKGVKFIEADASAPVEKYLDETVDLIFHLASPASPKGYIDNPIVTYKINSFGTHYLAEYARKVGARMLFASTSEVYGDPLEHPQKESYWGNVNPIGIRACYDESKRFGEMVLSTMARKYDMDVRMVRIFNTYGPRMDPKDGRVVPNFILQSLKEENITVHGDGSQTRSFCYVSDLVEYILRAMIEPEANGVPINVGHTDEFTMLDFAKKIKDLTQSKSEIVFIDRPEDDPGKRKPDLERAKKILKYEPQVKIEEGLIKTIEYFKAI